MNRVNAHGPDMIHLVCHCGYEGPAVQIKRPKGWIIVGCPYCDAPRREPTLAERLRAYKMLRRAEREDGR
jgi:hypothetical protein